MDLAVEGQGITLWIIFWAPAQWLVGVLKVNDGQAVEAKDDVVIMPGARCIRAAVVHALQGLFEGIYVLGRVVISGQ